MKTKKHKKEKRIIVPFNLTAGTRGKLQQIRKQTNMFYEGVFIALIEAYEKKKR